jgi:hypothetical protein
MPEAKRPECFVVMPFGKKPVAKRGSWDFDVIYERIICPAVHKAGMRPLRDDKGGGSHIIYSALFRKLRDKPVVLADLSIANPNVFYELGLRHVMSPKGTVLICRSGMEIPFDIKLLRVIPYSIERSTPSEAPLLVRRNLQKRPKLLPGHCGMPWMK